MLKDLVKLANHLDSRGLRKEADALDGLLQKIGGPLEVSYGEVWEKEKAPPAPMSEEEQVSLYKKNKGDYYRERVKEAEPKDYWRIYDLIRINIGDVYEHPTWSEESKLKIVDWLSDPDEWLYENEEKEDSLVNPIIKGATRLYINKNHGPSLSNAYIINLGLIRAWIKSSFGISDKEITNILRSLKQEESELDLGQKDK